jgi:hypothetical protein
MIQITFMWLCKLLLILDISIDPDGIVWIFYSQLKLAAIEWYIREGINTLNL